MSRDPFAEGAQPRPEFALPGVATVAQPYTTIAADLDRAVAEELEKLQAGESAAVLNVHTRTGVNLVVASRVNDKLVATLWVGKSGWDQPVREGWTGAVSLRAAWGGK